jgi:diguanylate cyclase (GGDEF)-like protein/PAS domain S-box-containing protein
LKIAPHPPNEQERLAELRKYDILDTEPEAAFNSMVQLAAYICQTPFAAISLVDENRQWFKAIYGVDAKETPRDVAFCAHTILQEEPLVVPNALDDFRFCDNPLVTGGLDIRFYAGVPLVTSSGYRLGTLCVIDQKPRQLSQEQLDAIKTLADSVMAHLDLRLSHKQIRSYVDELQLAASIFETAAEAMLVTDPQNRIVTANPAFTTTTGYALHEVVGKDPKFLSSGMQGAEFYQKMWHDLNTVGHWSGELWNRRKNGELYAESLSIKTVFNEDGTKRMHLALFSDVTQKKQADELIWKQANFDPLTGLPNRRLLLDRLQQAMASSARSNHHAALLFIDLDNFKALNDTQGHDVGDLLLQQVAQRLKTCVREGDTVARLGGDEFVIVLEELNTHAAEAAAQTETVGEKILATLSLPYLLAEHEHRNTPSIGATLFNNKQSGLEDIMKQADIAMYQAKKAGRNNLRFFDPAMQSLITARVDLESDLRWAVSEQEQFQLYYQPQVDSAGVIFGVEALLRWIHPVRGIVSPAEFIPLAEESGLILPLGHWVLATTCQQLANWGKSNETAHLVMAVNISAKQFGLPNFVEEVQALIKYFQIDPAKLKLEITESMLAENVDELVAKMTALKACGINFSMDDFGTGYSSLQYLKRLPLSQLKIDQSFVRDINRDSSDRAIVKTIIAMARSLDLNVIAEGVETAEQQKILLNKGCTCFQGYLFGKPVPIEQLDLHLKNLQNTLDVNA